MRKFKNKQGIEFLAQIYNPENIENLVRFIHLFDAKAEVTSNDNGVIIKDRKYSAMVLSATGEPGWVCWDPINKGFCYREDKYIAANCEGMLL